MFKPSIGDLGLGSMLSVESRHRDLSSTAIEPFPLDSFEDMTIVKSKEGSYDPQNRKDIFKLLLARDRATAVMGFTYFTPSVQVDQNRGSSFERLRFH